MCCPLLVSLQCGPLSHASPICFILRRANISCSSSCTSPPTNDALHQVPISFPRLRREGLAPGPQRHRPGRTRIRIVVQGERIQIWHVLRLFRIGPARAIPTVRCAYFRTYRQQSPFVDRMHKRGMQGDIFGNTRRTHGVGIAEDEGRGGERGHHRAHGINKNVCKYVHKTWEFAETVPGLHVTFVSNNAYE